MATKEKIAAVVGMLCEAFNRKPTAATFQAYRIGLDGVSDEALDEAATKVLSGSEFMPPPGRLRQLALTGGVSFEGRADIAWHEFDRAVASHGGDHTVTFDDGLINATVNLLGGWILCCEKSGDDYFVWLQKQFKEVYIRLCNSTRIADELRRPLVGRIEMANTAFPDRILDAMPRVYTGKPLAVGTSQPVLLPPAAPPKRIERTADGPKQIGEVLKQIELAP